MNENPAIQEGLFILSKAKRLSPTKTNSAVPLKLDEIMGLYCLVACCMETIPVVLVSPEAPCSADEQAKLQQMLHSFFAF